MDINSLIQTTTNITCIPNAVIQKEVIKIAEIWFLAGVIAGILAFSVLMLFLSRPKSQPLRSQD